MADLCVFCGSRAGNRAVFASAAATLGRLIAEGGHRLIYGGGKTGLMGIVAQKTLDHGGAVIGVIPEFLAKHDVMHDALSECVIVSDLFDRKLKMIELGDAFIALPGGFGTFDELLEVITWRQLGQISGPIGVLDVGGYFTAMRNMFNDFADAGFIANADLDILYYDDDPERLLAHLQGLLR